MSRTRTASARLDEICTNPFACLDMAVADTILAPMLDSIARDHRKFIAQLDAAVQHHPHLGETK